MKKIPMLEKFAVQSLVEYDGELIFSKEKFAELIVRECISLCQESIDDGCVEAEEPMCKIQEHFGVAE
jgi:hypothetical protein